MFVLDDLSEEIQARSLKVLLKKNRHFKCMTIVSTQANVDMLPSQKKQLNVWMIWKAEDEKKLLTVYKNADLTGIMPFSYFMWMYKQATAPKYGFLYIDGRNKDFRMNFDKQFIIPKDVFKIPESQYGEGIIDTIKEAGKRIIDFATSKREGAPPAVRNFLAAHGNDIIKSITVARTPVTSILQKALNLITFGKFNQARKFMNYDTMFHLFMVIELEKAGSWRFDKNEVVKVVKGDVPENADKMKVSINKKIPFGQFFDNGVKRIGLTRFYKYNFQTANCQMFVSNLLSANGLNNPTLNKFIMQDVVSIFKQLPKYITSLLNFATDAAGQIDILRQGKGNINNKKLIST